MYTKEQAQQEISELQRKFRQLQSAGRHLTEEETKKDLILPLFRALNWEVENSIEVSAEETISRKRVDYGFRIDGIPKFFLESKSLGESLSSDDAKQAMTYSWLKSTTWAVLTNFNETRVYNAEWKSRNVFDKLFFSLNMEEYITKFDKLWLLSKDAFTSDELDAIAEEWGKKQKKTPVTPVTEQLFDDLITWRQLLTRDISNKKSNRAILKNGRTLDESVQRILDRLMFIRVCEDRRIEPTTLSSKLREWKGPRKGKSFYSLLVDLFEQFNSNYDSRLFERQPADELEIEDIRLNEIIPQLYESRGGLEYDFSAIDADVLGNIYEQYLGYILTKRKKEKGAEVVESYEQRKKFGIYYTPTYIVDFIIRKTIQERLKLNHEEHGSFKILDPACGSGSFLIRALSSLTAEFGELDFEQRMKILTSSIYGVDIDPKAVEIAQVNLLLRILEKRRLLPELDSNVMCGDSIGTSSNDFDWTKVLNRIGEGFDVVIGNPPYVGWSEITNRKSLEEGEFVDLTYRCRPNHPDAQPNLYLFFVVRALSVCKHSVGFILPTEWLGAKYARDFRDYMMEHSGRITIYKFNPAFKVFTTHRTVGTNSLILIVEKDSKDKTVQQYEIKPASEPQVKNALQSDSNLRNVSTFTEMKMSELVGRDWNLLSSKSSPIETDVPRVTLDDSEYFDVVGGFQPPVARIPEFELNEKEFAQLPRNESNIVFPAVLNAHSIKEYLLESEGRYWIIANELDLKTLKTSYPKVFKILSKRVSDKKGQWWKFPNIRNMNLFREYPLKLLSPRTAERNSFAIDGNATLFKGTNTAIISKKLDTYYLAGVLNSELANKWYESRGAEYHGGEAKKYEPENVRESGIPIPLVESSVQLRIAVIVKRIKSLTKDQSEAPKSSDSYKRISESISETQKDLNAAVAELYRKQGS